MRILAITDSHPPYHRGGYQIRAKEILDRLRERGHSIMIATTTRPRSTRSQTGEEPYVFRGLSRECTPAGSVVKALDEFRDIMLVRRLIAAHAPDLIYLLHIINLTKTIYPFIADLGIPVVFDEGGVGLYWSYSHHGLWFRLVEHRGGSTMKSLVSSVLVALGNRLSGGALKTEWVWPINMRGYFNSEGNRMNAAANGLPVEGCPVILPGVDTDLFSFTPKGGVRRPLSIIAPGRIEPAKGQREAVRVLTALRARGIDATLALVGHQNDGQYRLSLETDILDAKVSDYVQVLPMVSHRQLASLYRRADVCLFLSYHKTGLSRVPLEAMASGCAVLSYGNEGSAEVIRDQETGYLVPEGDTEAATRLIERLIAEPSTYTRVVHHAWEAILSRHSMESYIDNVEAFLSETVTASRAGMLLSSKQERSFP